MIGNLITSQNWDKKNFIEDQSPTSPLNQPHNILPPKTHIATFFTLLTSLLYTPLFLTFLPISSLVGDHHHHKLVAITANKLIVCFSLLHHHKQSKLVIVTKAASLSNLNFFPFSHLLHPC